LPWVGGEKYCNQRMCMSVCPFVCLSADISQNNTSTFHQIFLYMSPVAVAVRYVLYFPFFGYRHVYFTSRNIVILYNGRIVQSQRGCICFIKFARWRHQSHNVVWSTSPGVGTGGEVCRIRLHLV